MEYKTICRSGERMLTADEATFVHRGRVFRNHGGLHLLLAVSYARITLPAPHSLALQRSNQDNHGSTIVLLLLGTSMHRHMTILCI